MSKISSNEKGLLNSKAKYKLSIKYLLSKTKTKDNKNESKQKSEKGNNTKYPCNLE